jgi:hypothetical protein
MCMVYCVVVILALGEVSGTAAFRSLALHFFHDRLMLWSLILFDETENRIESDQFSGPAGIEEVTLLNSRMGISLSGSLPLFILAIAIWALKTILFQVIACSTVTGIVLTIVLSVLIVLWIMVVFYGSAICLPPSPPLRPTRSRPLGPSAPDLTSSSQGLAGQHPALEGRGPTLECPLKPAGASLSNTLSRQPAREGLHSRAA